MGNFHIAKFSPYYIRCGSTIIDSPQADDIKNSRKIIEKMHVMWRRLIACLQQKRFSPTLNYPLARRQECVSVSSRFKEVKFRIYAIFLSAGNERLLMNAAHLF